MIVVSGKWDETKTKRFYRPYGRSKNPAAGGIAS